MNREIFAKLTEKGISDSLFIPDMELLSKEEAEKRTDIYSGSYRINDMTVFAINGGGDFWAWRPDEKVYFTELGTGNCKLFALNLADAVFRQIIECVSGMATELCTDDEKAEMDEEDAEYYFSESDCKNLIKEFIGEFDAYLSDYEKSAAEKALNHEFDDENALLSFEEYQDVITHLLNGESSEETIINK